MKLPIDLQEGEFVVQRWRRTPVYMIMHVVGSLLVAVLPVAVALWIVHATVGFTGILAVVVAAASVLWIGYWLARGYLAWYQHRNDEWILTDQRLIDSYRRHWFSHRVSSADLVNVQDISVDKSGLMQSLFNFGNVICQTAGAEHRFVLSAVPRPASVLGLIDNTRDAARVQYGMPPQSARNEMSEPNAPRFPRRVVPPDHVVGRLPPANLPPRERE